MSEAWTQIAAQSPIAVAIVLLVLQMRKLECEERHANTEKWQAFLKQRDEQWQGFLSAHSKLEETVIGSLIGQMAAVSKQMEAVATQMQAVQVAVEKFAAQQEYLSNDFRAFRVEFEKKRQEHDNQQPDHS